MHSSERHAQHAEMPHYERHRPEESVLYRVVSEYWSSFRESLDGLGSLPKEVRVRAGYDRTLCAMVLDTFIRELQRSYRWRAKCEFGLSSVNDAFTGMVTVIQRFDSALRLNVHFHTLALDGVYVKNDHGEGLRFLRLPRPTEAEVYEVALRTAKRVAGILEKRGRTLDGWMVRRVMATRTKSSQRYWRVTILREKLPRRGSWMVHAWAKGNARSLSMDSTSMQVMRSMVGIASASSGCVGIWPGPRLPRRD